MEPDYLNYLNSVRSINLSMPISPTPHMRNLSLFRCTLSTGGTMWILRSNTSMEGIKGPRFNGRYCFADYPNVVSSLELPIITNTS